jgi:hypothetical protein
VRNTAPALAVAVNAKLAMIAALAVLSSLCMTLLPKQMPVGGRLSFLQAINVPNLKYVENQ